MTNLRTGSSSTATLHAVDEDQDNVWSLVVAHHPRPDIVGQRRILLQSCTMGRHLLDLGPGLFDDEHISREHARLDVEGPTLQIRDLDSHNGTLINGVAVASERLEHGDVIGMGRLLLLVERSLRIPDVFPPEDLPGISEPYLRVIQTLRNASERRASVLIWGETGTGKDTLADFVRAGVSPHDRHAKLFGPTLPEDHGVLRAAVDGMRDGGSVHIDRIDEANPLAQQHLITWLDHTARGDALPVRLIATSLNDPDDLVRDGRLRPDLLHRFRGWRIRLPPLRERRSDIVVLTQTFARRYAGPSALVDGGLMLRLVRHGWPGNVRELEAIVERAAVARPGDTLRPFPELSALLSTPTTPTAISTAGREPSSRPHVVHRQGLWHRNPQGKVQDLRRHRTPARVLAVLLEHRESGSTEALPVEVLLARAWADERLDPRSGANRVYVALTTLRKLGLRDLLLRTETGYMLDPDAPVTIVDDD